MTYQPFLIANWSTGLDKLLQPWLIPDDAQQQLLDAYVYRGVMSKRDGYQYFATGLKGGRPYTESRIVNRISSEPATQTGVLVEGDGSEGPYTFTLQNLPVRRGNIQIVAGAQTVQDNGLGGFTTGSGTIDYTTGVVTVTFPLVVALGVQIFVSYDSFPGLPVMGIMNFVTENNTKELIVGDTKRLNRFNSTTNTLEYLGRTLSISGITNTNPGEVTTSVDHDLMTGDKVFIYGALGMPEVNNVEYTITKTGAATFTIGVNTMAYGAWTSGGTVQLIYSGTKFSFFSWVNYADKDGNPRLLFTNNADQIGYYAPNLSPSVGDYVNYPTNASPDFHMDTSEAVPATVTSIKALQMFTLKDRLILIRTTENGTVRPKRIRISGTGQSCDDFRITATGAGFIDIPDGSWIQGATYNRDDLIIWTEASTWVLKYTGDDSKPFVLDKIDESRGCEAAFSAFTYLNRSSAISRRGYIKTDGYRVERNDDAIPDFSFNEVDGANFGLCFSGVVDSDRDHYLIYPPQDQTPDSVVSKRILTLNYEEDNFAIYRLPLSCMGTFNTSFEVTWTDLLIYNNWSEFGSAYGSWNSFPYNIGEPISIGGGHRGEIWQLGYADIEDNPVMIRNITKIDVNTLEITTDWNNYSLNLDDPEKGADTIFISGVSGMVEINDQQFVIVSVTNNNVFRIKYPGNTATLSNFTSTTIGVAERVIPMNVLFKQFNPYTQTDQKVRCGWLYMYVSVSGTSLRRNANILSITQSNPCVVTTAISHGLTTGDSVNIFNAGGMTQVNGNNYVITVISKSKFSLNGIDSTAFTPYTSGGYVSIPEKAKADVQIYINDNTEKSTSNNLSQEPYQGTLTNLIFEDGVKKWYKIYINQTGKFIQFRVKNLQDGTKVNIHAIMPGFAPVGRLI